MFWWAGYQEVSDSVWERMWGGWGAQEGRYVQESPGMQKALGQRALPRTLGPEALST